MKMSEDLTPASADEVNKAMWYETISLDDARAFISSHIKSAARSFCAIGYYLKNVRDRELYREEGYESVWEFAQEEFGISKSTASRYMSMNDRFAKGGNSPVLDDQYREFNKSQLQEMLALTDSELDQVTPEMRVQEIRELRKPRETPHVEIPVHMVLEDFVGQDDCMEFKEEPEQEVQRGEILLKAEELMDTETDGQEEQQGAGAANNGQETVAISQQQLSAYGTVKRVYPEGSLIAAKGCEGGHYCDSCSMECEIRQEERWCVEVPCGNPFSCDTLHYGLEEIRETVGNTCEFINHELAYHRAGDGEPSPCCKHCASPCEYICGRAMKALDQEPPKPAAKMQQNEGNGCENSSGEELEVVAISQLDAKPTDMELLREMLRTENELLEEMIKVDAEEKLPENMLRKKKLLVAALAGMLCDLDTPEPEEPEQLELPAMKNNDQRKAWLKTFHDWPVWFEVPEASEVYYRYDLSDGSSLVICEYRQWLEWKEKWSDENPDSVGVREYLLNPVYHYLHDCHTNRTAMIEKLKEVQKKGRDDEED